MLDKIIEEFCGFDPLDKIKSSAKPVLLYGMGNCAEKMLALCKSKGIKVDGVFASDGFKTGKIFMGYEVISVSSLKDMYPEGFVALVCFGCKSVDMKRYIDRVNEVGGIVYMPHLPLFGGKLFTYSHLIENIDEIREAYSLLSDDRSKELFISLLKYFLTWDHTYLLDGETNDEIYPSYFSGLSPKTAIDGGAYRGDTVITISENFPSVSKIIAYEPDSANFKKLCEVNINGVEIVKIPQGLYSHACTLHFDALHNRGSHFSDEGEEVDVCSIDGTTGEKIDLIKLDVEGCEAEAISGAEDTIKKYRPALYVSLYHKTDDFFKLILQINKLDSSYKFALKRENVCPAWDIILLAKF